MKRRVDLAPFRDREDWDSAVVTAASAMKSRKRWHRLVLAARTAATLRRDVAARKEVTP